MNTVNFFSTVIFFAALRHVRGECWDTGCQPDSWLVKGCEEYDGMTEIKRVPCKNGHVYTCCYQRNSIEPSKQLCRGTECHLHSWSVKGCEQYDMIEVERLPCSAREGYVYFCCNSVNDNSSETVQLNKIGDLTYFSLGLTACGQVYTDDDMVAAIAFSYFTSPNPNVDPMCGKRVKIIDPTTLKYVIVTITDKCEGCKTNDIDVSPSAFEKLKPKIVGRSKVVWDFI